MAISTYRTRLQREAGGSMEDHIGTGVEALLKRGSLKIGRDCLRLRFGLTLKTRFYCSIDHWKVK